MGQEGLFEEGRKDRWSGSGHDSRSSVQSPTHGDLFYQVIFTLVLVRVRGRDSSIAPRLRLPPLCWEQNPTHGRCSLVLPPDRYQALRAGAASCPTWLQCSERPAEQAGVAAVPAGEAR